MLIVICEVQQHNSDSLTFDCAVHADDVDYWLAVHGCYARRSQYLRGECDCYLVTNHKWDYRLSGELVRVQSTIDNTGWTNRKPID